ncbi:MAG: SDR family NAD(P)-dependent oxidoreductase [Candidatus Paceibacteria bacterium]
MNGYPSHDSIMVDGQEVKLNIGSAVAAVLLRAGAIVHMVSTSEDKLENINQSFVSLVGDGGKIEYSAVDLMDKEAVSNFVDNLPQDKPIDWVQSVGLGAGSYKLKNDNPYLPIKNVDPELIESETNTITRSTHLLMHALLPILEKQNESRIAIVTSMSAIRGYSFGAAHTTAKGALDRYANSVMLGLYRHNIFVSTLRPGAIDTGMYDNKKVQDSIKMISDEYGGRWRDEQITLGPPTTVGEAAKFFLTSPAHVSAIEIVSKGQFPNEGS